MRRMLVAVLLLLLTIVGCSGGGGGGRAGGPLDATFSRLDGTQSSFASYRGTPVVVNFFASSCGPCVREMPALQQLHEQIGDKVVFLGLDVQETVAAASSFVGGLPVQLTWDIGRDPDASILTQKIGGKGLPTTAVLDRDGNIVKTWLGTVDVAELTQLLHDKGFS